MNIQTFEQANAALQPYIAMAQQMTGRSITLERMKPLMERLGNPQEQLTVIHVAGTSGKTSTAYYIAALLKQAGLSVGLTVSPHIETISERLQINLMPTPEAVFCQELETFLGLLAGADLQPSYFELLMAFAYWYFARQGVDYAVIETGLGGLHDASNVCQNANKICVLTDIGLDHTHVLGNNLTDISFRKAGIMHAGNQAFVFAQQPAVIDTFQAYAEQVGAHLEVVVQANERQLISDQVDLDDLPEFQQRNWLLAHRIYRYLEETRGLPSLKASDLNDSLRVQVPGRMEPLSGENSKTVVVDGAHNEQKMAALVRSFQVRYPGHTVPVLLAVKTGKEHEAVLRQLKPITSELIVTTFPQARDLPTRSIEPAKLAKAAQEAGFTAVSVEPDPKKAYLKLLQIPGDLALVTGSFYLVAYVRQKLMANSCQQ